MLLNLHLGPDKAPHAPCLQGGGGGWGHQASLEGYFYVYTLENTRVIFMFLDCPEGKYAALHETFLPHHSRRLRGRVASADGNVANR